MNSWMLDNAILICEVGSTAHGCGLPDKEDLDQIAITLEPKEYRLGLRHWETEVYRPGRAPGDRSQPGDLDLTIHSLHKWARLALKGNPSIISLLWAPVVTANSWGSFLRSHSEWFISKHVIRAFLGYATQQRRKLVGDVGQLRVSRPELVEEYGFDTKYAMHMVRLGMQGLELIETGAIQYPARDRDILFAIRSGKIPLDDVITMANDLEELMQKHLTSSAIPDNANFNDVNDFVVECYESFYE